MTNIVDGFEQIKEVMMACIEVEMQEGGLLEDVETFISTYHEDGELEEPVVWMTQLPTTADKQADISQTIDLITPFQFSCAVYESEIEESESAGQNLTNRVILAILRNYLTQQAVICGKRLIKKIELETYYPVGEVEVAGKSESVPVTAVVLNVIHTVNWTLCCKELKDKGD